GFVSSELRSGRPGTTKRFTTSKLRAGASRSVEVSSESSPPERAGAAWQPAEPQDLSRTGRIESRKARASSSPAAPSGTATGSARVVLLGAGAGGDSVTREARPVRGA